MAGHGHVTPNADGTKARCGGPSICSDCAAEWSAIGKEVELGPGLGWPEPTIEQVIRRDILRQVWDAMVSPHAFGLTPEATRIACAQVERIARKNGVTL
jgi:hypothetical protein